MKPYYYVFKPDDRLPRLKHNTLNSAKEEAERLALKHAGKSFEILKCIGVSQTSNVSTFWMDDETGEDEVKYRDLINGDIINRDIDQYFKNGSWVGYTFKDDHEDEYNTNIHAPHRRPV